MYNVCTVVDMYVLQKHGMCRIRGSILYKKVVGKEWVELCIEYTLDVCTQEVSQW